MSLKVDLVFQFKRLLLVTTSHRSGVPSQLQKIVLPCNSDLHDNPKTMLPVMFLCWRWHPQHLDWHIFWKWLLALDCSSLIYKTYLVKIIVAKRTAQTKQATRYGKTPIGNIAYDASRVF